MNLVCFRLELLKHSFGQGIHKPFSCRLNVIDMKIRTKKKMKMKTKMMMNGKMNGKIKKYMTTNKMKV
jgi:hypothetical protein